LDIIQSSRLRGVIIAQDGQGCEQLQCVGEDPHPRKFISVGEDVATVFDKKNSFKLPQMMVPSKMVSVCFNISKGLEKSPWHCLWRSALKMNGVEFKGKHFGTANFSLVAGPSFFTYLKRGVLLIIRQEKNAFLHT
jgi:hypothetical protein